MGTAGRTDTQQQDFSVTEVIREIGRGRHGARQLTAGQASQLFERLFADELDDLTLGAVLLAMRMKGETADEVAAALDAVDPWLHRVSVDPQRPVVSIPSYNGARRTANLTPLLAWLLADAGVQVIVHGVRRDPGRVTTAQLMEAMGLAPAASLDDASALLERDLPVFLPIDVLSPSLARVLDLRWRLGVRNIGHTLVKLINPTTDPRCLLLTAYTHPEFELLQHELLAKRRCRALISRGTEGEVFANPRRHARIDWVDEGRAVALLDAAPLPVARIAPLPDGHDIPACAAWMQSVLSGEREAPLAISLQVDCVLRALGLSSVALDA